MSDNVCVLYYVREKNSLKLAIEVAHVYNHYTLEEMSRTIGLEVCKFLLVIYVSF